MAYPKSRGEDPLNYDEYDPTPFSGGYDQVALYGRPKSPSQETCYPVSETSHHESGSYGGGYGDGYSSKPSRPNYGVDEERPTYKDENPPHGSDEFAASGYGKPSYGSKPSYNEEEGGYGGVKPSSYEEGGGYGGHNPSSYEEGGGGGYGSGYSRPNPSYGGGEEGGFGSGYGGPKPSYGGEKGGFGSGHGRPKPSYEEGGPEFASGYGEGEEGGYGRRPGAGYGRPHGEGYGGYEERPPPEDDRFGHGGRRPGQYEGEGAFGGRPPRFGGEEEEAEGGFGGGRRPGGFGGDDDRPSYFGDEPTPLPADEGFGGYQGEEHRHGHHHKHHWRPDEE
ncbi:hypothetical protein L7F22_012251 [Adiantum nelumboides]|nr:hypothetical protein [Adiantum nelumboides]